MSGGRFNYEYSTIEYTYCGQMEDIELNEMMCDLVKLLHDLEWWQSSDYGEETYRKTVQDFKKKWFKRTKENMQEFIEKQFEEKKKELLKELGYLIDETN